MMMYYGHVLTLSEIYRYIGSDTVDVFKRHIYKKCSRGGSLEHTQKSGLCEKFKHKKKYYR